MTKKLINVFWFKRDLRLKDNAGLYYALQAGLPLLPLFIFDKTILDKLPDQDDARVTFIHNALIELNEELKAYNSSILVKYNTPLSAWNELLNEFDIKEVFTANDYEPYALKRDEEIKTLLQQHAINFRSYKDHVIFEKEEIIKDNHQPYSVFSAYKRKWLEHLNPEINLKPYDTLKYNKNFLNLSSAVPTLSEIGFKPSLIPLPAKTYKSILPNYAKLRDYPAVEGTSRIGTHLRFGTISIREIASHAYLYSSIWLSELIWREFYSMILWHFPETVNHAFKREFDNIPWRNDEDEFAAWCEGCTGYPLVDAGMRQLNTTGWMHNRVRMITASFLTKHLLIDWRWGESYFARKLLDYDQASNVGGWQWAAGTGTDAAPYFRIFNPDLQAKNFDSKFEYIFKWIPEIEDPFKYPRPIVDHKLARDRALSAYKSALIK